MFARRRWQYAILIIVFVIVLIFLKLPNKPKLSNWPTSNKIVIYNRIPKTGSTTFTNAIAYDLYKENGFNVLHVNMTKNRQVMSLPDQYSFINNITHWKDTLPAFYHGHVAFVDFTRFGVANPIYINIVREPLERLLSHYYFLRYGDNFRVGLKRSRAGNNETFDDCFARSGKDCDMKQMWIQIPYFCGHFHFCTEVGSSEALEMAKRNVLDKYLLVGTTSRMRDMIAMLEVTVPDFFRGALNHFDGLDENRSHLRYTKKKIPPNDQTLSIIKRNEVYKMEKEFYDFVDNLFDSVFKFTDFALWVDEIVEERNLLRVPEKVWKPFIFIVVLNFFFAITTFIMGVICFSLGLHYSTFYTRINCNDGINIWIPLNNLIATWTGLFAIKALHIRWAAFTHFIFTIVMTPMMIFASIFATMQVFVWQEEQRLSRGNKNWGTENSNINVVIAVISYMDVVLSIAILCVYGRYWIPRNVRNNVDH